MSGRFGDSTSPFKDPEKCHIHSERLILESGEEKYWIPSPLKAIKQHVTRLKPERELLSAKPAITGKASDKSRREGE
jgi:hypothetical protein